MTFFYLMTIYIIMFIFVLGIMFIAGLALLLAGILLRKKKRDKKYPVVMMVCGGVLSAIPVLLGVYVAASGAVSSFLNKDPEEYAYVTDKWRDKTVYERELEADVVQGFLGAADAGDRDAFIHMFAPVVRNEAGFDEAVDEFLEAYPEGLSSCELEGGISTQSKSTDYGDVVENTLINYTCIMDGEWYRIRFYLCNRNTTSPDDVGVLEAHIENLYVNALKTKEELPFLRCRVISEQEMRDELKDYWNDGVPDEMDRYRYDLSAMIEYAENEATTARLINDMGYLFIPVDGRELTREYMEECIADCDTMEELTALIGPPNVTDGYTGSVFEYYYELVPEDGTPLFERVNSSGRMGEILKERGVFCTDRDFVFDEEAEE